MLKVIRNLSIAYLLGVGCGVYGYDRIEYSPMVDFIARGFCADKDPRQTLYFYRCKDSYIAAELMQRGMEADRAEADETKAIVVDLKKKKGKK